MKTQEIITEIKKLSVNEQEFILKELSNIVRDSIKIANPNDIYAKFLHKYSNKMQEHFIVLQLDGANQVRKCEIVTKGLLNSSQIHPRECFADAIKNRSASIIIAHNHPSGNPTPSPEDINITKKLKSAGEILGIPVLDHIIFTKTGYTSFLEKGLL